MEEGGDSSDPQTCHRSLDLALEVGLVRAIGAAVSSDGGLSAAKLVGQLERSSQSQVLLPESRFRASLPRQVLCDGRVVGQLGSSSAVGGCVLAVRIDVLGAMCHLSDLVTLHSGLDLVSPGSRLGQGLDQLGPLQEVDDLLVEHLAELVRRGLGEAHVIEEEVLVGDREFSVCRQFQVHFRIVLRDFDAAVGLALNKQQWKLELLVRVGHGLVNIDAAVLIIQELVCHLDIPLLELGDADLLLDELEEQLLLLANPLASLALLRLSLNHDILSQNEPLSPYCLG